MRLNLFDETEDELDARVEYWKDHCHKIGIHEMWAESMREASDYFDAEIFRYLDLADQRNSASESVNSATE